MQKETHLTTGLRRVLNNDLLKDELYTKLSDRPEKVIDRIKAIIHPGDSEELESDLSTSAEILKNYTGQSINAIEEAIIELYARPVLEIQNNAIILDDSDLDYWKSIIETHHETLQIPIQSVGRIELYGHENLDWVGTGWIVDDDILITNRHVAEVFAYERNNQFLFRQDFFGNDIQVNVDFNEEWNMVSKAELTISEVLFIEPNWSHDMAFLRIKWNEGNRRPPLDFIDQVKPDRSVAVIGYPARDSRTRIPDAQLRIFSGIYDVKRFAPGEIDAVDPSKGLLLHDCTTLGGCSGSPVIDIESQKVIGLHFSGKERQHNFAVTADVIKNRLYEIIHTSKMSIRKPIISPQSEAEERLTISDMTGRNGYNENFLNKTVTLPRLSADLANEIADVAGRDDGVLDYTNYSVIMNKERKIAMVAAVNINGALWRHVTRGDDYWYLDPRIDRKHQVGNELYKNNDLDRGHLVRRLDPAWGNTYSKARKASLETFFYTNCSPQHKNLNQKIWLGLEEYILNHTDEQDMKVSVMNGPVFADDDFIYRGIKIPQSYWKIAVTNHPSKELHATAYLLSQGEWLDDLEFQFGEYRTFQMAISRIEEITGLNFGELKLYDPLYNELETVTKVREVRTFNAILL